MKWSFFWASDELWVHSNSPFYYFKRLNLYFWYRFRGFHLNVFIPTDEVDEEEEEEGEGEGGEAEDLDDSRRASNRNYSLRRKPPKVVRYEDHSFSEHKPRGMYHRSFSPERYHQRFPSRRGRPGRSRKDHTIRRTRHHSTTSESDSETEKDEVKFEKRKKKSMNQARARCLPMNLTIEDIQKGAIWLHYISSFEFDKIYQDWQLTRPNSKIKCMTEEILKLRTNYLISSISTLS